MGPASGTPAQPPQGLGRVQMSATLKRFSVESEMVFHGDATWFWPRLEGTGRGLALSSMTAPLAPLPTPGEGNGRAPLPGPIRVGAATQESSTDITHWLIGSCQSLRVSGKPASPVPRALPGHLHKTLSLCQLLTDPSSSWKNQSHQPRGGRPTHARCPERWTLTPMPATAKQMQARFKTITAFRVKSRQLRMILPPFLALPLPFPHPHRLQNLHLGVTPPLIPSESSASLPGWKSISVSILSLCHSATKKEKIKKDLLWVSPWPGLLLHFPIAGGSWGVQPGGGYCTGENTVVPRGQGILTGHARHPGE